MKKLINILLCIVVGQVAMAQMYTPNGPADNYRTQQNPYYWKNKMPYAGYWQQDVHYKLKGDINERAWIIDGDEELEYFNNSPDTLTFVYFHLYQNAFQPGSYLDDLQKNNGVKPRYGKYESQKLGTDIDYIKSGGKKLKTELENTVMKVYLDKPLLPNSSTTFNLKFATFFDNGSTRRRMKFIYAFQNRQFNGTHWYPTICVYDRVKGWDTDQHLGREFYNDFGTWDVELTFSSNYIVEATGVLQNEDEVLPADLKAKLDIKNFVGKKWNSAPSVIIPYDSSARKTWKYHAENVHNFAFTASPLFRIGEATWNGIRCIALVQEPHAGAWQGVANYTAKTIEIYSRDFGMYGYPKMVVADAEDGMEYPMLTLCGGAFPSNKGLIVHEVGHNWFYGMIGNNETYQAPLDEGFTQFLTVWSQEHIDGVNAFQAKDKSKYKRRFRDQLKVRNTSAYDGYVMDAANGKDEPLNTHSDMFHGALGQGGGYRSVYMKTSTMLYNLQYVLGDSLFQKAIQHYFNQWKFAHPYIADFRTSVNTFTHQDLNWFFDEWMETQKTIDYSVGKVKLKDKKDGQYTYSITLTRKGRMQMPIDLAVVSGKDTLHYNIPNTWFKKQTTDSVLPRWIGWDKLKPTYTATVTVQDKIKNVIIDPSYRLADVNMLNNSKKVPIKVRFDSQVYNRPSWQYYDLNMRPDLWWNAYDGFKLGFHMNGNYMGNRHKIRLTVWWNTRLATALDKYNIPAEFKGKQSPISYNFSYETSLSRFIPDSKVFLASRYLDGLVGNTLGVSKTFSPKLSASVFFKSGYRPKAHDSQYILYPGEWVPGKFNNSINLVFNQTYEYPKGTGSVNYYLRSSALLGDFDYHYLQVTAINHTALWKFDLHTRAIGRYGTGTHTPGTSALFLASASEEDMMDNPLTRAKGYVPPQWQGYSDNSTNHFQQGGGLNLRGYAGYSVIEEHNGVTYRAYKGNSGAAINAELDFNRLWNWKPKNFLSDYFKFNTYLFADGGFIVYETNTGRAVSTPRMDAGAGIAMTIKKFGPFETIRPFTLRFDVPFYLSSAPAGESQNVKFRWVIGLNRTF